MDEYQAQIATLVKEDEFVLLFIKGRTRNQLTKKISLKNYGSPGVLELGMSLRINMRKVNRSKDLELLILFKEVMKMDLLSHLLCPIKELEIDHHR
ncbi:hypothetical protein HanXRQr2_Chr10g0449991 [Helianthus annuus]|uniref:Uncharacterized protein n=1 Tax=Helianthus annuus TaxID=4232 RepID=A0A9K3N559_HELAN|nr:hypothetical protein HanXRQr2_Chr10g0449991 [Helianthus annuus]KAJ0514476.1 hypothetical protein HanHA300_Chr10g0369911 [Helianthus annuus]